MRLYFRALDICTAISWLRGRRGDVGWLLGGVGGLLGGVGVLFGLGSGVKGDAGFDVGLCCGAGGGVAGAEEPGDCRG